MTVTEVQPGHPGHPEAAAPERRARRAGRLAVAMWAAGIAAAFVTGWWLRRAGLETEDALPPLHGKARLLTWPLLPAAGVAALAVAVLPPLARRLPWWAALAAAWAAAGLWAVALAVTDGGPAALTRPLEAPTEYAAGLGALQPDPLEWLRTFSDRLYAYTTHVRGHPPLPMLVLWALERIGFGGTGWAAAFIIAAGSSAVAAIAVTVRHTAGERAARRALPFLALAPLALWVATSMDAFFLAVGAWGTALVAAGARRGARLGGVPAAAVGGIALGALPYLSYGLLPLAAVPLAVLALSRPRPRVLAALACGLVVVPALFTAGGFWWFDGVAATRDTYLVSRGSAQRSYAYFAFADLGVLGLLTGPAVAHALPSALAALWRGARARARVPGLPVALLAGAALLGTLALDASGVTKGEVERIWVPYAAWVVVAAALHRPPARRWLAAQAVTALAVQALVLSHW
ncbi:hypothetical protein [Actinomadura xylanilytica]|uniref:hypothetical protein n=1 Tax=Actinomadura xylanilytica TaxID=887459 RepID=UPI00255AE959|nr:hypothetical protein [Actinomadura xylanilytica]MDL4776911.1 hypothetical protein [Actinomadura xylanilytica]